jgi:tRNA threonylcarbamoyladenosine biosynthesis protein TsaB
MRVLALEASTLAGGVALVDDERLVAEYVLDVSLTHSERLLATIDRVLGDAGWTPQDLDGIAVAIGPGSFTGLRVAVSTVKGLALALSVPVAAVPTLDAMAAAVPFAGLPVCTVIAARRNEVYACLYRWQDGGMRRQWDYLALTPAALAERLREPVILAGDGAAVIVSPHAHSLPAPRRLPAPACVAVLGLERLRSGDVVKPADLAPLYVRPPEAELKRRAADH